MKEAHREKRKERKQAEGGDGGRSAMKGKKKYRGSQMTCQYGKGAATTTRGIGEGKSFHKGGIRGEDRRGDEVVLTDMDPGEEKAGGGGDVA